MKKFVCTFGESEPTDAEMLLRAEGLPEHAGARPKLCRAINPELDQGDLTSEAERSGAEATEPELTEPDFTDLDVADLSVGDGLEGELDNQSNF